MRIIMYDGSYLDCNEIEFGADGLIADGYRIVPYLEVLRIVTV